MRSILLTLLFIAFLGNADAQLLFSDSFESGLNKWILRGERAISTEMIDPAYGKSLKLKSEGLVYVLVKGSEKWGPLSVTGEFMFPDDADNYLGFIYNETETNGRIDFGSIYIKGNDSYIRVNPFRDENASRLLYEEFRTPLSGDSKIIISNWHTFKMEVWNEQCHLYVDDMTVPKITFSYYEGNSGKVGFQPRVAGYPVFLDNIRITQLNSLSYQGNPIPDVSYNLSHLVTQWEYIGPFTHHAIEIEETNESLGKTTSVGKKVYEWLKFETDPRGAVVTGRVTEFDGSRDVAYFRTVIESNEEKEIILHVSTTDELGVFVNGLFQGYIYRNGYGNKRAQDWNAWHDFWKNENHEGSKFPVQLKRGKNIIMLRSQNGQFASGGFFMEIKG